MTQDEYNQIELLKDSLLRSFLDEVKSGTSWRQVDAFKFEGFFGPYAFLLKYYKHGDQDLIDAIKNLWDIVD
jgi:hypothetical protein